MTGLVFTAVISPDDTICMIGPFIALRWSTILPHDYMAPVAGLVYVMADFAFGLAAEYVELVK